MRIQGEKMQLKEFRQDYLNPEDDHHKQDYELYFKLLINTIQHEIEPLFKHKGRFEDIYKWREEFGWLHISRKSFEYDVEDKLKEYENEISPW